MSDHLINHKYTILEIERMLVALKEVMFPIVWHSAQHGTMPGFGGKPGETEEKIEVQLRTYMLNGTRPEELEEAAKEKVRQSELQRRSFEENAPESKRG